MRSNSRRWCLPLVDYHTYNETIVNVSAITDHKSDSETNRNMSTSTSTFFFTISTSSWLMSPGQRLSQSDDRFNSSGPVFVRNHFHALAVKFEYTLYSRFTNFPVVRELTRTSVSLYVPQRGPKGRVRVDKNIDT